MKLQAVTVCTVPYRIFPFIVACGTAAAWIPSELLSLLLLLLLLLFLSICVCAGDASPAAVQAAAAVPPTAADPSHDGWEEVVVTDAVQQ